MSVSKTLFGVTRTIPETDEVDWGDPTTDLLADICDALATFYHVIGANYLTRLGDPVSETFTAAQVLTVTKPLHIGEGASVAVTITLANGTVDGHVVRIMSTDSTKTITILNSGNMLMRSDVTLENGESIELMWISSSGGITSKWVELSRST